MLAGSKFSRCRRQQTLAAWNCFYKGTRDSACLLYVNPSVGGCWVRQWGSEAARQRGRGAHEELITRQRSAIQSLVWVGRGKHSVICLIRRRNDYKERINTRAVTRTCSVLSWTCSSANCANDLHDLEFTQVFVNNLASRKRHWNLARKFIISLRYLTV